MFDSDGVRVRAVTGVAVESQRGASSEVGQVERTFAWLMRSRRLARDYEERTDSAEAMILWSMSMAMSRRMARPRP